MLYDVFISHASEDKDEFVRPLAEALQRNRIKVWYDEFSLTVGDSLRRSIDIGLAKSTYGIIVLSKNFMNKNWSQWELDGLVQRQIGESRKVLLPIWHNVTQNEVMEFSPPLADKLAISSGIGLDCVVAKLLKVLRPEGSTLIIARDELLDLGYEVPVITDDWWLDMVEFSASNDMEGTFQEAMGWGYWGFPLPPKTEKPSDRGHRLAMSVAQNFWQERAADLRISQVTHPNEVMDFIQSTPAMEDVCCENINYLIAYAPQLTIRGFGGPFEDIIESVYLQSVCKCGQKREKHLSNGTGLTINGLPPACGENIALRHPTFGDYGASFIACDFVQGDIFGPPVKVFAEVDYAAWLISDKSIWMPSATRQYLIDGIGEWGVWPWVDNRVPDIYDLERCEPWPHMGDLVHAIMDFCGRKIVANNVFTVTSNLLDDIQYRLEYSRRLLGIDDDTEVLTRRFLASGIIERTLLDRESNDIKQSPDHMRPVVVLQTE